jgi:predicted Zn-dependent peptidase
MKYFFENFSNGLKLINIPNFKTKTVAILALFPVGSRYENKNINGASHFIEHLMFKGTKKRPSNFLIAKELDSIGADYNAFTSKDLTGYWIKFDKKYLENGLEILSDILFNSLFEKKEFEKEKSVILEEIKMYEDNPSLYIEEFFEQVLYPNLPLGRPISGSKDSIKNLSYDVLLNFKEKFYQIHNLLISVAGNLKEKECKNLIKKYFGKIFSKNRKKYTFERVKRKKQEKMRVRFLIKDTQQIQLALGFPAYSLFHPKIEALKLFSIILGGYMSSRLFSEIRVKRGLAYFIKTSLNIYQDTGNFVVLAGIDEIKIKEVIKLILEELNKIKKNGVTEEELERAKNYYEGKLSLDLEDSAEIAAWYGKQKLLKNKILTPEEKIIKIKKVKAEEIQKVANDILKINNLNIALIGPSSLKNIKLNNLF